MLSANTVGLFAVLTIVVGGIVVGVIFARKDYCQAYEHPTNLTIEDAGQMLEVSWLDDIDNLCGSSYKLRSYYVDQLQTHITDDLFANIEKPAYCTEVEVVLVRLSDDDERVSLPVEATYTNGIRNVQVRNFKLSEENKVLKGKWDAPDNLDFCNVTGDISYELKSDSCDYHKNTTELEFELSECTGSNIIEFSIEPIINNQRGSAVTDEISLNSFRSNFNYISEPVSVGNDDFIRMSWQLGDVGSCPTEYVVSCSEGDTPAIDKQISEPYFDFRSCPISDKNNGHNIDVIIKPVMAGCSSESDRHGQARICKFHAYYESSEWLLDGDCEPFNDEQYLVQRIV